MDLGFLPKISFCLFFLSSPRSAPLLLQPGLVHFFDIKVNSSSSNNSNSNAETKKKFLSLKKERKSGKRVFLLRHGKPLSF
jgi:hypothetical protein